MGVTTFLFAQTIAPKKCNTCGKPLTQCQYKGRHPKQTPSQTPFKQTVQKTKPTSGYINHEWVDLGLPSGTKWATMNIGATSPSDYGSYFAWGETSLKRSYAWKNLKYCLDTTGDKFSKYVTDSKYGDVDGKKELDLSDDAAYVNWGAGWCMPSDAQLEELRKVCKWTWTRIDGHNGYKVDGLNGNSIFLPASGHWSGSAPRLVGTRGDYWSRTLDTSRGCRAYGPGFYSSGTESCSHNRYDGQSVRAVRISE